MKKQKIISEYITFYFELDGKTQEEKNGKIINEKTKDLLDQNPGYFIVDIKQSIIPAVVLSNNWQCPVVLLTFILEECN